MEDKILGFRIWYSDSMIEGQTYDDWINAPDDDVQVVLIYRENSEERKYRHLSLGFDYYALTSELRFLEGDIKPEEGHIKTGKWTTDDNIEKLHADAVENFVDWIKDETKPLPHHLQRETDR